MTIEHLVFVLYLKNMLKKIISQPVFRIFQECSFLSKQVKAFILWFSTRKCSWHPNKLRIFFRVVMWKFTSCFCGMKEAQKHFTAFKSVKTNTDISPCFQCRVYDKTSQLYSCWAFSSAFFSFRLRFLKSYTQKHSYIEASILAFDEVLAVFQRPAQMV